MQRVLIVGLGPPIGGSIGLALRRWSEEHKVDNRKPLDVVGFDQTSITSARRKRWAQSTRARGIWRKRPARQMSSFWLLRVNSLREVMADLAPNLQPGVVVTDTGSPRRR